MRGPEEWPSRRSNPADRIRLTGPAANKLLLSITSKRNKARCDAHLGSGNNIPLTSGLRVIRRIGKRCATGRCLRSFWFTQLRSVPPSARSFRLKQIVRAVNRLPIFETPRSRPRRQDRYPLPFGPDPPYCGPGKPVPFRRWGRLAKTLRMLPAN